MVLEQAINTVNLLALGIAPACAICIFIVSKDKFEKEPLWLLLSAFIIGCVSVLPAAGLSQLLRDTLQPQATLAGFTVFAFGVISFSEESIKFLSMRYFAYPKKDFNEPFDGIVYSVMIAMGFATVENIMYIFLQDSMKASVDVSLVRMFTAVPAHACMAIMMGYYAGLAKFSANESTLLLKGFMAAFLFHGLYDFLLSIANYPIMTIMAITVLYLCLKTCLRAIRMHQANSPFRRKKIS